MTRQPGPATNELPSLELVLPPAAISLGRAGAATWVEQSVRKVAEDIGFGGVGHTSPPSTTVELQSAFARSAASKCPLPVAEQPTHPALMGPRTDLQLAFWRSVIRFRRDLGFSMRHELLIDLEILDRAAFDVVNKRSRAVLYAALIGQSQCRMVNGRLPRNPRQFVFEVLTYGMTDALLLEHERT